jgi:ribosomal protein S18 acetylase RimI-like enzyme
MVRLRPYPADQLEAMWAEHRARYEGDLVDNGGLTPDEARAKAARDGDWLRGLDTLVLEIELAGERVGRAVLWLDGFGRVGHAWLFEIVIDEEVRGRGLGRAALRLLENEARARGMRRMELNVFGGNEAARSLYRRAGYTETSVHMAKPLD